jgi:outer membrane protein TolC
MRKLIMKAKFPIFFLGIWVLFQSNSVYAQARHSISLDTCLAKAKANYPLIKNHQLITQSYEYSLSNAAKGYLPQFLIMGQVTYQSDVPNIQTNIPGVTRPLLDKDQYKVYGEINQSIFDGGVIKNQRNIQSSQRAIDFKKLELDLYSLNERIYQLYFGILLLDEQLKQNELFRSDIELGLKRVKALVKDGAALKSNEDILKADLLRVEQKSTELKALRLAFAQMLAAFIGEDVTSETALGIPKEVMVSNEINRPELGLFSSQKSLIEAQQGLLSARNLPKLNLFLQGGYAKPGFDFFKNELVWYYIGGVRLNWNFSGYYTLGKEKKMLGINSQMISVQQETFLFNTNNNLRLQQAELDKFRVLLNSDKEILTLRKRIAERSLVQLENGIIQASDYMRELNAADMAQQNKILHQIQFLQTQYNQKNSRGN